ncbi:hypothetical protein ACJIZ3_018822 [Penstemon smallii]|uniref:Protein BIG GRAIN 1-like B n=1 Tax=Penstemon smallii TaxID=265156 RepID=A0ABD3T0B6_9LAMI
MATWARQTQKPRRKTSSSFSSSLLDTIYNSTDTAESEQQQKNTRFCSSQIEQEIENLRRAIKIEKWMEHHNTTPRHFPSHSSSSADSSLFSSSETESPVSKFTTRFAKTKSRALKIYGDLKRVKEPISPGGKISNFLNSIFSPKTLKKNNMSSISKSRSMKDTTISRSCLNKSPSSFCTVSTIILDEDKIDTFRVCEGKKVKRNEFRDLYERESDLDDNKSCASSDLFELENIGRVGFGAYEYDEELPVFGTTSFKLNQAIAMGW